MIPIDQRRDGASFAVKLSPRAGRDTVVGLAGNELKVTVSAAPEKGKANEAMLRTLARWLPVERRRLRIVSGQSSRHKRLCVTGMTAAELAARLGRRLGEG